MRSYNPEELFDEGGRVDTGTETNGAGEGNRRISANPHANGGLLRKPLRLPDFRDYAVKVTHPGHSEAPNTHVLGTISARRYAEEHD